ncbi:flagellar basal-body MS-ring/collar protein FliF [Massilia sp. YIM B04103]|uniref:flagellar basal-body MS-ring/collar protein FliF n=1 Tax=Massilia sp. YIM B04103 TaxID=2963106 RepID=UPI00210C69B1|nr:flagellar basal-body MS-ring/collar protein FliF [Massilia sp. YIM B04103]
MFETWKSLSTQAKAGIAGGAILILGLTAGLGFWAYRADYQVLFAEVAPADAAAMTAELDRMKTPYQLADGGNTILVPKDVVYKTRLQLMGKDIPLHGAVGFEVFNNADFGMTEFVQKVNYQRAVQGELTRTILSIEEIQAARVHLALPEQGLFKKTAAKSKASVTLTMKRGQTLQPEQVAGIQRLVAASVPEIASADVTVLNQHGVALTRVAHGEGGEAELSASQQLDSKRGAEEYLLKKVNTVLERTFGPGEAVASVDVLLDMDQSRVTTEEVLAARGAPSDALPAGVMVRERQTTREGGAAGVVAGAAKSDAGAAASTTETDYQVGRRVEQQVTASGKLKRMTVAVLVKQPLNEGQLERLKEVVALATGLNAERGDAIVVQSMDQFASPLRQPVAAPADSAAADAAAAAPRADAESGLAQVPALLLVLLGALVLGVGSYLALGRRRQAAPRLAPGEREQMLQNVRQWIGAPGGKDAAGGGQ